LTKIEIPIKFKALLNLGTKYCLPCKPNNYKIKEALKESVRKISWNLFFKLFPKTDTLTENDKWFYSNKKDFRKTFNIPGKSCSLQDSLFNLNDLYVQVQKRMKVNSPSSSLDYLISELKKFLTDNNIMITEADKNAGLCIVYKEEYKNEILRQLGNLSVYNPTTYTHFERSMADFHDKLKCFQKKANIPFPLHSLTPKIDKPASFYILPKIHKPFTDFPKGRPISSTFSKTNKYASKLLDFVLKPCTNQISDLIIDTQHFLLMIQTIKLDPCKKYTLVTVDIEALYPSLHLSDCITHCVNSYNTCDVKTLNLSPSNLIELLNLSLRYNYIQFENEWFYQHRGIEMGNSASVMVANITVYHEVFNIFSDINECVFYKRFLDDIFMIVESENINDMNEWLEQKLKHKYLKFTFEFSETSINFLDTTVNLSNCKLSTGLFVKPMSRHKFLHATSNHPKHLKDSLFYSQGLRIIRICSDLSQRNEKLCQLMGKFKNRWYENNKLYETFIKLIYTSRFDALRPKKKILIDYLCTHNPEIVLKYNISNDLVLDKQTNKDLIHLVFPFYNNVHKYSNTIREALVKNLLSNATDSFMKYIVELNIRVVFSRTRNMREMLK
jgi:hypothetical protein